MHPLTASPPRFGPRCVLVDEAALVASDCFCWPLMASLMTTDDESTSSGVRARGRSGMPHVLQRRRRR